jgi:hypothetical protein
MSESSSPRRRDRKRRAAVAAVFQQAVVNSNGPENQLQAFPSAPFLREDTDRIAELVLTGPATMEHPEVPRDSAGAA